MTDFETMQPLSRQIGAAHDMMQQILKDPGVTSHRISTLPSRPI